ncbi:MULTISPECIES: signal peptide peptidase SppA [unclassified Mesorhizobium]|uniref:signal peptide peptidase SppA n=1 Tax=unclassified Mesorhizobium TaxID=325217 RepID=UPI000FD90070|nr:MULTISPECIES: signal peptide peptidase SppA [unclassified Mesorhizobium]TGQ33969.1 signal peptide peptidase SppA [Mesorhizobium sp. M00.F.Ca.ET.216.01.1.1]TIS59407.1 MAG: signal peptide peptidase SppA [Mesorhizobium sp.]TIS91203.1 MAG: signal peptide peptidase SppA [Mesorhizobium sp.]TJW05594.1 MAG: signal peptide peptidase SppA [Mesorhizobium sp.]
MALRADDLIDRRRLRRKLTFWRVAAFIVAAAGVIALSAWFYGDEFAGTAVDHIAKVKIEGTITEDEELIKRLETIRESPKVKGVILSIDSPGGTTVGGESIYEEVRKLAADKPVVAEVGTLAASAGYMIASAADHIVARKSSIVGSIGVLIQYPDVSGLMDKLGIKLEEVKSSPLKASPSPFKPTSDDERSMVRKLILDSYDWFVGIVAERRSMTRPEALALADGSIFTGRQALANRLVDAVGGETEAIDWLATKGVDAKLKVVEWKNGEGRGGFLLSKVMTKTIGSALGLPDYGGEILHEIGADRLFLDGLVSVWHP